MCEPTTIAMLAISAVSAVAAHKGQERTAKQQERATRTNYNMEMSQLDEQRRQENVQTQQAMSERGKQAMLERARLRAASADGGTGGNTLDRIFGANEAAAGQDMATMAENASNTARQSGMTGMGMQMQSQGYMNQIQHPSWINTGLQIAGSGVSAYKDYKATKPPTTTSPTTKPAPTKPAP